MDRSDYLAIEIQVPTYSVGSLIGQAGEKIKNVRRNRERKSHLHPID